MSSLWSALQGLLTATFRPSWCTASGSKAKLNTSELQKIGGVFIQATLLYRVQNNMIIPER